jgi:tRNA G10  N-methylase Trm11
MQSLLILGRQPALGLAEVESLYGGNKLQPVSDKAVIVDIDPCLLAFDRLGGSVKFCKILTTLDTVSWPEIEKFLIKVSPVQSETMPAGKMTLGLSLYGFRETPKRIEATGLSLKKVIRKTGRPVRLVPNKSEEINSAQVLHNKLTHPNGWELVFIKHNQQTIVAQTVKAQDIEAYTRRDRDRPKRDAKVGMLPPKLAQIITNLAAGQLPVDKLESICDIPADQPIPKPLLNKSVLDPFCGTGVVLQEALLMGYGAYGSDLEQRMVDYSIANIMTWLRSWYDFQTGVGIEKADATTDSWGLFPPIDFVASETYLGRPFTSPPSPEILAQTMADCNLIIKKFLRNIYGRLKSGSRLCLAVPAWQTRPDQFKYLPLIDQIEDLGYNRVSFEHSRDEDLVYYRSDQITARQLLVITRK